MTSVPLLMIIPLFLLLGKRLLPGLWINGTNDIAFLANKGNILCATSMGLTLGPG